MRKDSTPPGDDFEIRCPRLGHHLPFSYCRVENKALPCHKIMDCWYQVFMIEDFLRNDLEPEEWETVFNRPFKPKVLSLIELIEEAKRTKQQESQ
jgi:hypothetical protein